MPFMQPISGARQVRALITPWSKLWSSLVEPRMYVSCWLEFLTTPLTGVASSLAAQDQLSEHPNLL